MAVVVLMVMAVDILLLSATARLLGSNGNPLRIAAGALLDAGFAALSLVPGYSFMSHILWRLCSLLLTGLTAFGMSRETVLKLLLFSLLQLSLGGVTGNKNELSSVLLGAAGMGFACLVVGKGRNCIPVELTYGGQTVHLTALRDSGNSLRDPITGKQILVVGADVAQKLTGLTPAALADPVKSMGTIPGLRLIPYQTVGNTGFLLAMRIPDVKIGNRQGSTVVAFSPKVLGSHYQALTGGII